MTGAVKGELGDGVLKRAPASQFHGAGKKSLLVENRSLGRKGNAKNSSN